MEIDRLGFVNENSFYGNAPFNFSNETNNPDRSQNLSGFNFLMGTAFSDAFHAVTAFCPYRLF